MSDTQEVIKAKEVSKITPKDLGNPKGGALMKDGERYVLGRIFGLADGTKIKTQPNGDVFEAITGQFEATRAEDGVVLTSGILYLPGGFHERMASGVREAAKNNGSVQFAIEIATVKSGNAAGYSYEAVQLVETGLADPLEALRSKLPPMTRQKAISSNDAEAASNKAREDAAKADAAKADAAKATAAKKQA